MAKEGVTELPRGCFRADLFTARELGDVFPISMKFEIVLAGEIGDELLVFVGLRPAQFVVEVDDGKNDPEFVPQLKQKPEERYRVDASGDSNADPISGVEELVALNVLENALG